MPRIRLVDATVRAVQPPARGQVNYIDVTLPGFSLRVAAGGAKRWIVTYHRGGRVRRVTFGRYPLLSLADARAKAKHLLGAVMQGHDPAAEKQAARNAPSFSQLVHEYLERHAKPKKRSWKKDDYMLRKYVPEAWYQMKVAEITRRDIRAHLEALADHVPAQANRTLALLRTVFNFAVSRDMIAASPCARIERPAQDRARDRVLTADEIRRVWAALADESAQTTALFKLYFLTAQRGGELRTMAWADLDLASGWWTVPAERAKNKLAHRVPLSSPAMRVLQELGARRVGGSPWVFPSESGTGYREDVQRAVASIRECSGVEDFRAHDIRRTVATFLTSELGVSRLVVSKLLNHVETGVTKVYDRASYDREKQAALNAWAAHLESIVTGTAKANVVSLFSA